MSQQTLRAKFKLRRDTATNWSTNNPILDDGEVGYDTTNKEARIGNGVNSWSSLKRFITRDSVIDLILDSSLARDLISEWINENKYDVVDAVLEPIINGTWRGYYLVGATPQSPIEVTTSAGLTLSQAVTLSNYTVNYAETGNDEVVTVSGTLSFETPNYVLSVQNCEEDTTHRWKTSSGSEEVNGETVTFTKYTYMPEVTFTTSQKLQGTYTHSIIGCLRVSFKVYDS